MFSFYPHFYHRHLHSLLDIVVTSAMSLDKWIFEFILWFGNGFNDFLYELLFDDILPCTWETFSGLLFSTTIYPVIYFPIDWFLTELFFTQIPWISLLHDLTLILFCHSCSLPGSFLFLGVNLKHSAWHPLTCDYLVNWIFGTVPCVIPLLMQGKHQSWINSFMSPL